MVFVACAFAVSLGGQNRAQTPLTYGWFSRVVLGFMDFLFAVRSRMRRYRILCFWFYARFCVLLPFSRFALGLAAVRRFIVQLYAVLLT